MAVPRTLHPRLELPCGWGSLVDIIRLGSWQSSSCLCGASQIRLKASKSSKVSLGRENKMGMVIWQDPENTVKSRHLYLALSLWFNNTEFASRFCRGHNTEVMDDLQIYFIFATESVLHADLTFLWGFLWCYKTCPFPNTALPITLFLHWDAYKFELTHLKIRVVYFFCTGNIRRWSYYRVKERGCSWFDNTWSV